MAVCKIFFLSAKIIHNCKNCLFVMVKCSCLYEFFCLPRQCVPVSTFLLLLLFSRAICCSL